MRSYPYPPDEFDAAARSGGPRGVHRAPRSRWSRWWPFVVVLLLFPALAYAGVTWLSDWEGLNGGPEQPEVIETPDEPEEPSEETPETPEETPEPPPLIDLNRPVEVLNATATAGLAGQGGERLEVAGFTTVTTGNWEGTATATSVVYYGAPDDVTTAELVAETLGIASVVESAEQAPEGIVVVLAGDYQNT